MEMVSLFESRAASVVNTPAADPLQQESAIATAPPPAKPQVNSSVGGSSRLDRARVLDLILSANRTVAREYLDQFEDHALRLYLDHLESANRPRGRESSWPRPGDTPGIIARESRL